MAHTDLLSSNTSRVSMFTVTRSQIKRAYTYLAMLSRLLKKDGCQVLLTANSAPSDCSIDLLTAFKPVLNSPRLIFLVAISVRLLVTAYMQSFQIQDTWKFGFE